MNLQRLGILTVVFLTVVAFIVLGPVASLNAQEGQSIVRIEKIGPLAYGLRASVVKQVLGAPQQKKMTSELGSPIEYWKYPDRGITLKIGDEGVGRIVQDVRITSPCKYKTMKKVGIGSTYQEVASAYSSYQWETVASSDKKIVVGTLYDGLIFSFKNGRVSEIFLGAAAE